MSFEKNQGRTGQNGAIKPGQETAGLDAESMTAEQHSYQADVQGAHRNVPAPGVRQRFPCVSQLTFLEIERSFMSRICLKSAGTAAMASYGKISAPATIFGAASHTPGTHTE
jgi:hypothetical protein